MKKKYLHVLFAACAALTATLAYSMPAFAQDDDDSLPSSLLVDTNGNGIVDIAAFGDSITRGTGDFVPPDRNVEHAPDIVGNREAGYPLRIENRLSIPVANWGDPGEQLLSTGVGRFINLVSRFTPDVVLIMEGANDALRRGSAGSIYRAYQRMVNFARAVGTTPVVMTVTPTCCGHTGSTPFVNSYKDPIRDLARVNDVRIADGYRAYQNTCNLGRCRLLTLPEGLHPNSVGYDVLGETVIAALLDIDLFAPDGPTILAQALGVDPSTIITKPDFVPAAPTPTP